MNTQNTNETIEEYTERKGRQEVWGNISESEINNIINTIEKHTEYWNDNIQGMVFVVVKYNTGYGFCIFHPTSRRETTSGEYGKLGVNLRNGTIVNASLLSNIVPAERGGLSDTINGAFNNFQNQLQKVEKWAVDNWGAENELDKLEDWLPINLTNSIVLPTETLEYLQSLPSQLSDNELREEVWQVIRSQIHFMVGWQKDRVVDNLINAINREQPNTIPLTKFMTQLTTIATEMKELAMQEMASELQKLKVQFDIIDYSYADINNFKVLAGSTQAGKLPTNRVKRSNIVLLDFSN